MGSLLDSHPELQIFPLEVKFLAHWYERLAKQNPIYHDLTHFFLDVSKIALLQDNGTKSDIMNSGRINTQGVDLSSLFSSMRNRESCKGDIGNLLQEFLTDIHNALDRCLGYDRQAKFIVSKEGNHGLPHVKKIARDFPGSKFIVIVRDPRDIYCSLKAIAKKKADGIHAPSFQPDTSPIRYIAENLGKNPLAYEKLFATENESDLYLFVRYEDLVVDPRKQMKRVSKFLNIEFDVVMCTPTIFGQVWGGNASSMTQFSQISSTRINKWSQELTDAEVRILEHFLKPYLRGGGYELSGLASNRWLVLKDIVKTNYNAWPVQWRYASSPIRHIAKNCLSTSRAIYDWLMIKY